VTAFSEGEDKGAEFRLELPAILKGNEDDFCGAYAVRGCSHLTQENIHDQGEPTKLNTSSLDATIRYAAGEGSQKGSKRGSTKAVILTSSNVVRSVLVVDDSGPSRKVLCRLLRNAGYTCYEAADGEDCVAKMTQFRQDGQAIDMVFMDFEMPKMNGPDATQALRDMGVTIPIIGVTGNVLRADKEYFLNHGANAVLHKPLSIEQLKAEIARYGELT